MKVDTIGDLLRAVRNVELAGGRAQSRRRIRGFSTDTRSLKKSDAFIALVGDEFDGHDFLDVAADAGASIAVVSRTWLARGEQVSDRLPLAVVDDTLAAYGQIAAAHRAEFTYPVIAVAGSNGKTTTKELIADILSIRYDVLRTEGNLNNLIGVPATILRMTDQHSAAVIEIGTNTPGEIEQLCRILRPTHGIVTNIGSEHLELLGSLDGVAEEEGALFRFLAEQGGTAFVNLDDPYIARMAKGLRKKVTYGRSKRSEIRGKVGRLDMNGAPSLEITDNRGTEPKSIAVQLRTPGTHTAINALAAAAVGLAMRVSPAQTRRALAAFEPRTYKGGYARLAVVAAANGATILNDTYNANPDSVLAALDTIVRMKPRRGGRRIVVLADMKELGASSPEEHARIGRDIAGRGSIDVAMFFGDEMRHAYEAIAGTARSSRATSMLFERKEELSERLAGMLSPSDIVLVKGSRGMKMEEVVGRLLQADH